MDDITLLQYLQQEDTKSKGFTELMNTYQKRLYWHIRKIVTFHEDADDVLQNTFIKVWNNIQFFKGESSLYTWLYRIATNESITYIQAKKRKSARDIDSVAHFLQSLESDTYFDGDAELKKLLVAVETLPEKQKIVFKLKYFNEMQYNEMAETLGTSEGALKASYHHAVQKIQEYFKQD